PCSVATKRICSIDGCGLVHEAKGYCRLHYYRWKTTGDPGATRPSRLVAPQSSKVCSVSGCEASCYAKNLCRAHYTRLWRYGDPTGLSKWAKGDRSGSEAWVAHVES